MDLVRLHVLIEMVANQCFTRQRISIQTKPCNHSLNLALEITPQTGQYERANKKGDAVGPERTLGGVQLQTEPDVVSTMSNI